MTGSTSSWQAPRRPPPTTVSGSPRRRPDRCPLPERRRPRSPHRRRRRPSDFTPVTTTPEGEPITEEMLNQFKREGDEQSIRNLVATNGQCAPL